MLTSKPRGRQEKALVISDYDAPFPHPLRGRAGDRLSTDRSKATGIPGWIWCTAADGRSGWVPESYLRGDGANAFLLREYDAIELTVRTGDVLVIHAEESGFCWTENADGRHGWVPTTCLRRIAERAD